MKINVDIPEYSESDGLVSHWEHNFTIEVSSSKNQTYIKANKAGLVSLAIQLLTLAQDEVEVGRHFHYDHYNSLEEGSVDLIIEKAEL